MSEDRRSIWLAAEFAVLYVVAPAVIWIAEGRIHFLPPLLLFAAGALLWLLRARGRQILWTGADAAAERRQLRRIVTRFVCLSIVVTASTAWLAPSIFLSLPKNRPLLWALIMLLYPLLSVSPQEILYRAFLFERFRPLFRHEMRLIMVSTISFGLMHVIFYNWLAVAMTLAGGALFAETWSRTRSLRLVCLEHALWGDLIFTIGLGRYFYLGNVGL